MNKYELNGWEDDELYISLVCLFSHWPDYRLAHYLNFALGFSFTNRTVGYSIKRRGVTGKTSVFVSSTQDTDHVYLIDNNCFASSGESGSGLFNEHELQNKLVFINSLSKWPYLLLKTCSEPERNWNPLLFNKTITNKTVDIQSLKKADQNTLNEFIYAE